ncbi:hypothetical protein [Texcoconibacillus texcoconensis]|uniref:Uncharacterized protein n=1 Tax=Texcoconibacillus texcoconensis TaxID=1095777 RepID=A0A840QMN2_9BACI|nr:hypothetical protein [Texcoconibacillus texcoconensis]MBB5172616.1 hypothetical protein [Texcoconibacillus texcoconensis]
MGKKKRKNKKRFNETEDFGTCVLYCKECNYEFEVDWETIFEIQECTHGYVGFHLNDVFIDCPKCHVTISDKFEDDNILTDSKKSNQNITLKDNGELPF